MLNTSQINEDWISASFPTLMAFYLILQKFSAASTAVCMMEDRMKEDWYLCLHSLQILVKKKNLKSNELKIVLAWGGCLNLSWTPAGQLWNIISGM